MATQAQSVEQNRTRPVVAVRLPSPDFRRAVDTAAASTGLSRADWLRAAIVEKLTRDQEATTAA